MLRKGIPAICVEPVDETPLDASDSMIVESGHDMGDAIFDFDFESYEEGDGDDTDVDGDCDDSDDGYFLQNSYLFFKDEEEVDDYCTDSDQDSYELT